MAAEYTTIRKRTVKTPETVRELEVPAEYDIIRVTKVVSEPSIQRTQAPAEFDTITRTEIVASGELAWRQVLCETNTTPGVIRDVQRALYSAGHNPGSIDGVLGRDTMLAIRRFQESRELARGGLTIETVRALGL